MFDTRKFLINNRPIPHPAYEQDERNVWMVTYTSNDQRIVEDQHNSEFRLYQGLIDFGNQHTLLTLQALEKKYDEFARASNMSQEASVTRFGKYSHPYFEWVGKWGWIIHHYNNLQTAWDKT
jgi:hypothetical protein